MRRRPVQCHRCGGRGITYQEISRLRGIVARRPCRHCRGNGIR